MGASNQFDDTLTQLGTGKWNLLLIASIMYWTLQIPCISLGGSFLAPQVDHSCLLPEGAIPLLTNHSNTTQVSPCEYLMMGEDGSEEIRPCTRWIFDNSTFYSTLTSEFELVCDYKSLRPTYTSIYFIGACLSSSISGWLSDKYGRKRIMAIGTITYAVVGNCLSWLPNMSAILVFRFIVGLMHPTSLQTAYTIVIETTEPRLRSVMGIMIFLPWTISVMTWGAMGYLFRDWRWLMIVSTVPSLLFLPTLWFLDESPRWLIVQGQHDRAMKVLEKAARWNKATLPPRDQLLAMMQEIQQSADYGEGLRHSHHHLGVEEEGGEVGKKEGQEGREVTKRRCGRHLLPRLCSNRPIRVIVIIMCVDFLVASMVFYGLSLNGASLSADPFLYLVLTGLMEVPAYTLTVPIIARFGRRIPTALGYFVSAISILTLAFIPLEISWLVMTLAMLSKMCITAAYQTLYVYVTELLPTEVRIQGSGAVKVSARIGSTVSPFITDYLSSVVAWGPALVFGGASMVAGLVTLTVSETLGTPLPDTLADLLPKPQKTSARESDLEGDTKEMVSLMT